MIHATAIIHPKATVHPSCTIGPYVVVDAGVVLGAECVVGPGVHLTGETVIGAGNRFHSGAIIGDAPQDLKYNNEPTRLIIGDRNVFREHVTIHRSNKLAEDTVIGSHNFFMAHSHVGHNCTIGDHVIVANGALLAGHVMVQSRAFISGNCLVHQFARIGSLALMQGGSAVSKDLPPFTVARGRNGVCGLNVIGLRRAGISPEDRAEIKRLYQVIIGGSTSFQSRLDQATALATSQIGKDFVSFARTTKRGLCGPSGGARQRPGAHAHSEADLED